MDKKKVPYKYASNIYYLHIRTTSKGKGEGIFLFHIHVNEYVILSPLLSPFDRKNVLKNLGRQRLKYHQTSPGALLLLIRLLFQYKSCFI